MINTRILNFTLTLVAVYLTVNILVLGKSILIPLVTAIVIWYLLERLFQTFSTIPFTKIGLPKSLAMLLALITTALIIYLLIDLVRNSLNGILEQTPLYQEKINSIVNWIYKTSNNKVDIRQALQSVNMTSLFSDLAVTLTSIAGNLGLITVYVVFLMLEFETFDGKLRAIANSTSRLTTSREIVDKIITDINAYMKIKTLLSLATAISIYFIL